MSVKLRFRRMGRKKHPIYALVATDARSPRDGRFIEDLGRYEPVAEPARVSLKAERILYWLGQGAQPSDTVRNLLSKEGLMLRLHLTRKGQDAEAIEAAVAEFTTHRAEKQAVAKTTTADRRRAALEAEKKQAAEDSKRLAEERKAREAALERQRQENEDAERATRAAADAAKADSAVDASAAEGGAEADATVEAEAQVNVVHGGGEGPLDVPADEPGTAGDQRTGEKPHADGMNATAPDAEPATAAAVEDSDQVRTAGAGAVGPNADALATATAAAIAAPSGDAGAPEGTTAEAEQTAGKDAEAELADAPTAVDTAAAETSEGDTVDATSSKVEVEKKRKKVSAPASDLGKGAPDGAQEQPAVSDTTTPTADVAADAASRAADQTAAAADESTGADAGAPIAAEPSTDDPVSNESATTDEPAKPARRSRRTAGNTPADAAPADAVEAQAAGPTPDDEDIPTDPLGAAQAFGERTVNAEELATEPSDLMDATGVGAPDPLSLTDPEDDAQAAS